MSRYIDADVLKEWLDEYLSVFKKYDKSTIKGFVDHAPTIEPKRGEWKEYDTGGESNVYECSVCGEPWELNAGTPQENNMNFCPNCGADMRPKEGE